MNICLNLIFAAQLGVGAFCLQVQSYMLPCLSLFIARVVVENVLKRLIRSKLLSLNQAQLLKPWAFAVVNVLSFSLTPKVFTNRLG